MIWPSRIRDRVALRFRRRRPQTVYYNPTVQDRNNYVCSTCPHLQNVVYTLRMTEYGIGRRRHPLTSALTCKYNITGHPMPSLHIGILPVQSNSPENEMTDYVSCCATWEIKTKINLVTDMHSHYTYKDVYAPGKTPFGKSYRGMTAMYNQTIHGFASVCNSCSD